MREDGGPPDRSPLRESVRPSTVVAPLWRTIVPATLVGVFLAELFVMWLLDLMNVRWGVLSSLLDAALLTVLILPGLYLVVLRPVASLATRLAAASANARFRAVVDAAGDGIIVGNRHGRICLVNPAATKMLGYPAGELEGAEIAILVPEEQREQHRKGLRRYVETNESRIVGGSPVKLEARIRDGGRIPVELTLSAPTLHAEGLIVAVIRDLRQRRRMELYEGLLPVCCVCGVIRDDTGVEHGQGKWVTIEDYVQEHEAVRFSHTFCPTCHLEYRRSQGLSPADEGA